MPKFVPHLVISACLLYLFLFPIKAEEPSPVSTVKPSPLDHPAPFSYEEVEFIHTMYRNTKINEAISKVYKVTSDPRSGAITNIELDKKSPIAMLICTKLFKSEEDFESARFEAVYKKADEQNKVRVWNTLAESVWITDTVKKKCTDDPVFFAALIAALK